MAKDPAFLFYYQDFLVGTTFMTFEERGAYITLLCHLADKDHISEKNILKIVSPLIWEAICCKFKKGEQGYFNERLRKEVLKRQEYTTSRRKNLHMESHMESHMENTPHMENVNVNKDKDVYREYVYLTKEEYNKLLKELGEPRVKSLIIDLNNYIGSTGRRYKSHYHTILTWARKEMKPKPTEAQKRTMASFKRLDEMEAKK